MQLLTSLHYRKSVRDQALLFFLLALSSVAAFAQTNTPVPPTAIPPTATNVILTVPTNQFFTSANSWITQFAPVLAIGVGIAVALAILRFIGKQIVDAF